MKRTISDFDRAASAWLLERPKSLRHLYGWLTLIGHPAVVLFVAGACIAFGFGLELSIIAYSFIGTMIAYAFCTALKLVLRRPRPGTPYAATMFRTSFSFPSGHTFGSVVVYGMLGYFAAMFLLPVWAVLTIWALWLLIFLIGVSRVYLGAHYVLDVVGGWLLGIGALLLIIFTVTRL